MSAEMAADAAGDDVGVSRAELAIERDKVQIERERLAFERERLAAERERWKADAELRSRAEGRGIGAGTLVLVAVTCVLAGVLVGVLALGRRPGERDKSAFTLGRLPSALATNVSEKGGAPIVLRAVEAGSGRNAYLLILD
jgi:hypothetical protein